MFKWHTRTGVFILALLPLCIGVCVFRGGEVCILQSWHIRFLDCDCEGDCVDMIG